VAIVIVSVHKEFCVLKKMNGAAEVMKWIFVYFCLSQCVYARRILEEPSKCRLTYNLESITYIRDKPALILSKST